MDEKQTHAHIMKVVLDRIQDQNDDKRKEALSEFMAVTRVTTDGAEEQLASLVPPIMNELYEKWVRMFADRLIETVPMDSLGLLCDGTDDSNAALVLAYIMFLESERMEKQVDEDLGKYGMDLTGSDEMGDLASSYIRARMQQLAEAANGSKKTH